MTEKGLAFIESMIGTEERRFVPRARFPRVRAPPKCGAARIHHAIKSSATSLTVLVYVANLRRRRGLTISKNRRYIVESDELLSAFLELEETLL